MTLINENINNKFICTDTANGMICEYDENGKTVWKVKANANALFEVWQLDDGTVLYPYYNGSSSGVRIIDKKGNTVFDYDTHTPHEIFSCQPLEDGRILIGQLQERRLIEINRKGETVKTIPIVYTADDKHEVMRSVRRTKDGGYMFVSPGMKKIVLLDGNGKERKSIDILPDAFGVVIKSNGNYVYGCRTGIYEIDEKGNNVWTFTNDDAPLGISWILGLYLRKNGNIVASNWLGHGCEGKGVPIFEVTPEKEVVWTCDCRKEISQLGSFYLLDEVSCKEKSFNNRK